jgi:Fe-S-cluster containining protein
MDATGFLESFSMDGLKELRDIYAEYDTLFKQVNQATGFGCLEGCGACCHTPGHKIEVSIFEMVPLALELVRDGKAEETYDLLGSIDTSESVCIHYKMLSDDGKKGYCTVHPNRPLICRLFAGGSRIDRLDNRELVLCKPLKERYAEEPEVLAKVTDELPIITEFAARARQNNPTFGQKLMPINESLKLALSVVLMHYHFYMMSQGGED